MMDCSSLRPDLAAYTLGSLDDAEVERVTQHLAGCASCRAELASLEEAAVTLPAALAAVSPLVLPDRLKDQVLTSVLAEADQPESNVTSPSVAASISSLNHAESRESIRQTALLETPANTLQPTTVPLWRRPLAWSGLAAAIVLAVSLAWGVRLSDALDRERAMRAAVASFYKSQQAIVFEVVDAESTVRRVLLPPTGSDFPSRPYGKLFTRPDMTHVVAMANRLPAAPSGQTYHLWITLDGSVQHAGVLTSDAGGFGVLVFDADRSGPIYSAAWITLQPVDAQEPGGTTVIIWRDAAE